MKTRRLSLLVAALLLSGCAHPSAIRLPTVAAVRAPILAAQKSVARAVAIDRQEQVIIVAAQSRGLAAGSAQAKQLLTLGVAREQADAQTQEQLTRAVYKTGDLERALAADQAKVDALARDDAAKTREIPLLERAKHHWQLAVLVLLVADFFFGAPIQRGLHWLVSTVVQGALAGWKFVLTFIAHVAPLAIL